MHQDTTAFLEAMRDRTAICTGDACDDIRDATERVMAASAEAVTLHSMFRRAQHWEPDQEIASALGEYGQKLDALRKTGDELEQKALRFERILVEIAELEARVGDVLREPAPPDA